MQINFILNGTKVSVDVAADTLLLDLVRSQGCASVKRGCETSNCGLCTVFLEDKPVLSCSVLAARADGKRVTTLEAVALDSSNDYAQLNIAMPTQDNLKGIKVAPEYKVKGVSYYAEILEQGGVSYAYCFEGDNLKCLVFNGDFGSGNQQIVADVVKTDTTFGAEFDNKIALNGYTVVHPKG